MGIFDFLHRKQKESIDTEIDKNNMQPTKVSGDTEIDKNNIQPTRISGDLLPVTKEYLHNEFGEYSKKPTPGEGGKIFDEAILAWNAVNYDKAFELLTAAIAAGLKGPEISCAHSTLGQIYIHRGNLPLAMDEFLKCLEIPDRVPSMSWQAAMHLYYIYDELGYHSEANSFLYIAEKANEDHRWVHTPRAGRDARFLTRYYKEFMSESDEGEKPLHYAAWKGYKDIAKDLIAEGADVNERDNRGVTPLHLAVEGGHKEIVEFLINKGADVNAKSVDGGSPLHVAACFGYRDGKGIGELLIAKGADVNAKGKEGRTPLDYGTQVGKDLTELLKKHGAKKRRR